MDYEVKSQYIKRKIKGQSFRNARYRKFIQSLIFIERCILLGVESHTSAMTLHSLKDRYRGDYEAILQELKPREYRGYHRERKAEVMAARAERSAQKREEKAAFESIKKWWLSMGGKA
jgi:hypothetical protein